MCVCFFRNSFCKKGMKISAAQAHGQHDLHTVDWCGLRDYLIATGGQVLQLAV